MRHAKSFDYLNPSQATHLHPQLRQTQWKNQKERSITHSPMSSAYKEISCGSRPSSANPQLEFVVDNQTFAELLNLETRIANPLYSQ